MKRNPLLGAALHCIKVGRAFGIDVRIHWSFWVLPIAVAIAVSPLGIQNVVIFVTLIIAFYACVVFHEYGHALTARLFRVKTRDIILTPLGGIARLETMPDKPVQEIVIALAGPATSLMIFFGLLCIFAIGFPAEQTIATFKPLSAEHGVTRASEFIFYLMLGNLGLALFNMLPAFPSDGGRVLRAVLELFVSRLRATEVAVYLGALVALCLAVYGVLYGAIQLPFIAVLFAFVGQMELWMVRRQSEMQGRVWAESQDITLDEVISLNPPEPNFTGYTRESDGATWVEWRRGCAVRRCRTHGW